VASNHQGKYSWLQDHRSKPSYLMAISNEKAKVSTLDSSEMSSAFNTNIASPSRIAVWTADCYVLVELSTW